MEFRRFRHFAFTRFDPAISRYKDYRAIAGGMMPPVARERSSSSARIEANPATLSL
jgi:hypothetical protein